MTSVASLIGIIWESKPPPTFRLLSHAMTQAEAKGFRVEDVLAAAQDPTHTYDNGRFPGQKRHIRGGICAVVDPVRCIVITVYTNVQETALRPDQKDADAKRYGLSCSALDLVIG